MVETFGGERGEQTQTQECRFCELPRREEILLESEWAYSFPSLGALIEGWMLVSPRSHVFSLSELDGTEWDAFRELAMNTRLRVEKLYGTCVTFEHGAAGSGRGAGCGVNHAHLHVVPMDVDLRAVIAESSDKVGTYDWNVSDCRPAGLADMDYIHLSDRTGSWITYAHALPSQVVRRALARLLQQDLWDWKSALREDLALKTVTQLRAA